MSQAQLFTPLQLGPLRLDNRIVIAPMCQYSATEGTPGDWHLIHLGHLALSGAGLMILEATAVEAEGRISPGDLGLYSDANEEGLARVLAATRAHSPIKIAMQLGHAGRKASSRAPWEGGKQIPPGERGGWKAYAPSAVPHAPTEDAPLALDAAGLARIRNAFVDAARRAARLGLDGLEIHAAHGYLLHQFLSPLANHRDDAYGGSLENRMRFPLEVFDAVREAFPADRPVWVRVSAVDWVPDGWDLEGTVAFAKALEARGCAAIHVSSGGVSPKQAIALGAGYQVPFAERVKSEVGMPVIAVGLITEPRQAEEIIAKGQADAVSLARAILYDPRWPWHAAAELGAQVKAPHQYWRSQPREFKDLFENAAFGAR
ncbi:2,4-dienoyl-CoA reductase-like NADH-dependent reductase (Old Yellow Enzyme family) [Variovorax boronicumulans]|uniref:NADH:flavin oxidoreductase/NADH oxidase n=1 Tax=Variovorax boronicumulans TaxID=436515 RepID=UPI00278AD01D|nr:NADH:flavin oxidoreductase/NADH oxidase [Variovorax boronicumulans]MDQ0069902.1 2,4-dienoyl-CoA reductase-like NADH-dependent reductase (Old Yellow Enzyme family) [Variovorax boronicumulans]